MVQTSHQQQAIERTVEEQSQSARTDQPVTECIQCMLNRWPNVAEHDAQRHSGKASDDRYKSLTSEKRQVGWQFNHVKTVIQCTSD